MWFLKKWVKYIGHMIFDRGKMVDHKEIEVCWDRKVPTNFHEKNLLDFTKFYRRFVDEIA